MRTRFMVLLLLLLSLSCVRADILVRNAQTRWQNDAEMSAWLSDVGITLEQVQNYIDWETGFAAGDVISNKVDLLPGGLVIRTSDDEPATIESDPIKFGNSKPVGNFALSRRDYDTNETPTPVVLDFSAKPVDYVSFYDIDQAWSDVVVNFVDETSVAFRMDSTNSSGDSAEFFGLFCNDKAKIKNISLTVWGDGRWGLDNIRYGTVNPTSTVPEPSSLLGLIAGMGTMGGMFLRRRK